MGKIKAASSTITAMTTNGSPRPLHAPLRWLMSMHDCAASPLAIRLFGPFEAQLHGAPLRPLRTRKVQWLLALLILRHPGEVERSWLAGLLWPNALPSQAL